MIESTDFECCTCLLINEMFDVDLYFSKNIKFHENVFYFWTKGRIKEIKGGKERM